MCHILSTAAQSCVQAGTKGESGTLDLEPENHAQAERAAETGGDRRRQAEIDGDRRRQTERVARDRAVERSDVEFLLRF
jgi:hypothetical protein